MRPGQNKRSRGRNNSNFQNPNRPRMPQRMQTFDSSGPNIKIRGNAYQVFERYVAMAREAASSGDRIAAENFYQHAEHYFRIMNANGDGHGGAPRPTTPADTEMNGPDGDGDSPGQPQGHYQQPQHQQPQQYHQPQQPPHQHHHQPQQQPQAGPAVRQQEPDVPTV